MKLSKMNSKGSSIKTNSILHEIGWDEGFSMPVANADNKRLETEVTQHQRSIVSHQNDLEETEDRIHAMFQHLKNVRQELQHTQGLVGAREKETETEDHMMKIAEREEGRLNQEITRLQKELEEQKERRNIYENSIFKQTQHLEDLKSQMNWDQQALEAWLEESARKDEDAMTLQKYTRQDESKVKELSLLMERLTGELQQKHKLLDRENTETMTSQIELDKTAEDFRKSHLDRQELISQWEQTIEQMQRRDKEMDLLAAHLARVKAEVKKREDTIKEKEQFHDNEHENNMELEKKISLSERSAAKMRLDHQDAETQRIQFYDELETLKRTVDRTAMDLEVTRSDVTQLKKEVNDKTNKLQAARDLHEQLIEKLKVATESTLSAEERSALMEDYLSGETEVQHDIEQKLRYLRDTRFRKTQELHDVRVQERNNEAEIEGGQAALRNLNSKINKLDHDSLKQQEIIYNQDFSIQQLERRINRMQGERSNEEKLNLESKILELTKDLEHETNTCILLGVQLKRLQDDTRRVSQELEKSNTEKSSLTSKIQELNLHNDSSERELRKIIGSKQDLMVDENILKLEIKHLRDILNDKADQVLSLEKRRLQLETVMKERQHEVSVHKDMLQAQLRTADSERQKISAELHERISKIDKLRKRYEILMVSMAPPDGEAEQSQAYYVIKAAQEKEELQREGDELDAKIRKAEREIRALENTVHLMNSRNETYRKSFNKVSDTSDEMDEKQQLEEQMRAVMDKYKFKRRLIRELQDDLQTMGNTMDTLTRDEGAYMEMIEEKKTKILHLNKDLDEQRAKLERVAKQNSKYARELRSAKKSRTEIPEERDFELREMREYNRTIMRQIGDVTQHHPEISDAVKLYFTQSNLPPPTPTGGVRSQPSSARSSLSSVRGSPKSPASSPGLPATVDIGMDMRGTPLSSRSGSSVGSVRSGKSQASTASSTRR